MKTEIIKLSQVHINAANPRRIKDKNFDKLVDSILVLPKMLGLRPVVVDNTMTALGGNMRYRALCAIADLDEQSIRDRLNSLKDFRAKTQAERDALVEHWLAWKDNPTVEVANASNLSDAEKREFIIKDNVSFGEWDFDALANEWDSKDLDDWGVDVWQANEGDNDGDDGDASEGAESDYTHKIAVPTYEPRGDAPNIGEMYDTAKRDELLRQIEATPMPDDVRRFLVDAAQRHTVFNYEKIADFYAHADAEIQSLMEKSALVIIDFDKAIENGFVKLSEDLAMQYKAEYL